MLFIIFVLIALTAVAIGFKLRVPGGVKSSRLGWMSEQWVTNHRASRRS